MWRYLDVYLVERVIDHVILYTFFTALHSGQLGRLTVNEGGWSYPLVCCKSINAI